MTQGAGVADPSHTCPRRSEMVASASRERRRRGGWAIAISFACAALLLLAPLRHLEAQEREPLFEERDALIAGSFLAAAVALAPVDVALAGYIQDSVPQANRYLRSGAGVFRFLGHPGPIAAAGALYGAGHIFDRPEMAAVGLHTAESIVLALGITYVGKALVGRARPAEDVTNPFDVALGRGLRRDRYQSFPSGHTTAAFAAAAAIATEMGYVAPELKVPVATVLFSAASLAGVSRMYHNAHWASDVVIGAAIGTFAGWKVVRYHRTRPGNRVDEIFLGRASPGPPPIVLVWAIPLAARGQAPQK